MRIELTLSAWEADVLPLNYICVNKESVLLGATAFFIIFSDKTICKRFSIQMGLNGIIA